MAYPECRSMNADLWAGATDGRYKKVIRDRGGFPEPLTPVMRQDLYPTWYGIVEAPKKVGVCGKEFETPGYMPSWPYKPPMPYQG
ncbi:hypothetical protein [Actinomadura atramentaria]|uniref:hypothetical protein n=1 Tax=Actinomadura atramentaria TaxID=1990 RepID=UPI0003650CC1|nr:hypothetical protein [Actinomadura atramentaria]